MSQWAGQSEIRIRFETFGRFGNNIYIDNVEVSNAVAVQEANGKTEEILIYPNPSDATFNIILPERKEAVEMQIRDISGQLVHSETVDNGTQKAIYNATQLSPGIYFISFTSSEMNVNRKIIVQ